MSACSCTGPHEPRRIVLTGGPGAGKTAVLELVRHHTCAHVTVLPESAGIVFRGGFPRTDAAVSRRAAQRAIFHVQHELEATLDGLDFAAVLCDRGTIDGVAYWPGPEDFWSSVGTTRDQQLTRYHAVIHLRTPTVANGYNHDNPLRIESVAEAVAIDERIAQAWAGHPRRIFVESERDFFAKAKRALDALGAELPACCRGIRQRTLGST